MLRCIFILLLLVLQIAAQDAPPLYQSFDCTNPNFRVIYTACHAGDYSQCCAVGTDCCAGGCCPLLAYCVGKGTSQEKCCAGSDGTNCGLTWLPDVICEGMDGLSSFACPHGSTCGQFADVCDTPDGGSSQVAQSTPNQAASSSAVMSSPDATSTTQTTSAHVVTSDVQSTSTAQSVQPATVTVVSTPHSVQPDTVTVISTASNQGGDTTTTSSVASVSVVTVSATQGTATTTQNEASSLATLPPVLALLAMVSVFWWL